MTDTTEPTRTVAEILAEANRLQRIANLVAALREHGGTRLDASTCTTCKTPGVAVERVFLVVVDGYLRVATLCLACAAEVDGRVMSSVAQA